MNDKNNGYVYSDHMRWGIGSGSIMLESPNIIKFNNQPRIGVAKGLCNKALVMLSRIDLSVECGCVF